MTNTGRSSSSSPAVSSGRRRRQGAHPADRPVRRPPEVRHRIAFLPDYDMSMARLLYWGCDVWLNNPLRPLEACGTSGMKSALNGGLNLPFATVGGRVVRRRERLGDPDRGGDQRGTPRRPEAENSTSCWPPRWRRSSRPRRGRRSGAMGGDGPAHRAVAGPEGFGLPDGPGTTRSGTTPRRRPRCAAPSNWSGTAFGAARELAPTGSG